MTTLGLKNIEFRRILMATDFSETSRWAMEYAKCIARRFGSHLLLAYVNPPLNPIAPPEEVWFDRDPPAGRLRQQLEETGAKLQSEGFRSETVFLEGKVQDEIASAVREQQIDLLVLGTHGRSGIERLLFGSDAEAILRHVSCPTFTVGPAAPDAGRGLWTPRDIVCATDLDPESAWFAAYAFRLALQFEAQFALFHVEGPKDLSRTDDWERFECAASRYLPAELGLSLRDLLSNKKAGIEIVEFVKSRNSDLIVMGVKAGSAIANHLIQGVAPKILAEAPCPVLTLRHPQAM